ncbi:MAG: glycosyltransferase [Phycisphaerae bacterium]|nr:glycosyltransferase [Tepidisphaeraceae bacterium]
MSRRPDISVIESQPGERLAAVALDHVSSVAGDLGGEHRVRIQGKLFRHGNQPWYLKGFTYGPFAPNRAGRFLPEPKQIESDFRRIGALGANAVRVYHVPPPELLDAAFEAGLRVFVDVPWEKHRCFFEDWEARQDAVKRVRAAARELGDHPALLALSVGNEIPSDIIRFYGARRVERFVGELLDVARQEAPQALLTYTNYPSTEFLNPSGLDFYCANVYLEDAGAIGRYLDRLQHVAGTLPLVLGEYGVDTIRHGEAAQAQLLGRHVRQGFRRGLAGSFVFSFTDDWFTGGSAITDWAFGVTDARRQPKPAAGELARAWADVPCVGRGELSKASVVVCSYNGGATLDECLRSLQALDYPDYEVILVDDGSADDTPAIAARFPDLRYVRQENMGLSVARNVGARVARGVVVAYTDSDCVADPTWLTYLVRAMLDQQVEAVGGPNVPPGSDNWTAKCVAASPGGPSHVMFDDRYAEHVPGCNMAFRRDALLALGGFDAQFRQAGDDVDVCWRFLDAGKRIGYAPAAWVWHHRRGTVRAYLKQQKGYGRSEAMLGFKHPHRFNARGCARWNGVIYGEGAVGLPVVAPAVHHGRFGLNPFQIVYRQTRYSRWAYVTLLEWHALALMLGLLGVVCAPLLWVGCAMAVVSLSVAAHMAWTAPLPAGAPWWCRPLVAGLHLAQPVVRAWHRAGYRLSRRRLPDTPADAGEARAHVKRIGPGVFDLYFESDARARGREHVLPALEAHARQTGWNGDFHAEWELHDVHLYADPWHDVLIRAATEELGWPKRFTRLRCRLRWAMLPRLCAAVGAVWAAVGATTGHWWVGAGAGVFILVLLAMLAVSRARCRRAVAGLALAAAKDAGLMPVIVRAAAPARTAAFVEDRFEEADEADDAVGTCA